MSGYLLADGGEITLGTRVRIGAHLARRYQNRGTSGGWKIWERIDLTSMNAEREGIVVGVRTLIDGVNEYNGYDEPIVFLPRSRFRAILVSTDLHLRPVFARFEDVEVLP